MTKFSTNCGLTFLLGNRCSASLRSSGKNPFSSHLLMRKVNSILAGVSPFWIFLLEDKFSISFFVSSRVLSYDVNVNFPINSNFLIVCTLIRGNEMYFGKQKLPSLMFSCVCVRKIVSKHYFISFEHLLLSAALGPSLHRVLAFAR